MFAKNTSSTKSFHRQQFSMYLKFIKKHETSATKILSRLKITVIPLPPPASRQIHPEPWIQLCSKKKIVLTFLFVLFSPVQIIIQNLTTYSVYTVNVQAASLSAINPRRILLGLHSTSRKVNAPLFAFHPSLGSLLSCSHGGINFNFLSAV